MKKLPEDVVRLLEKLEPYEKSWAPRKELNYSLIPVNKLEFNDENIQKINELTTFLVEIGFKKKIKRTKSGGICTDRHYWSPASFDLRYFSAGVELTIVACCAVRIQLGHIGETTVDTETGKEDKPISGRRAFRKLTEELKKDDVNIAQYSLFDRSVEERQQINSMICKPWIKAYYKNSDVNQCPVLENVHHLDFHKAYASGLYLSHPEMRPTLQRLYDQRHTNKTIKAIFTHSVGFMHSEIIEWEYANLAKDAINTFNERLTEVAKDLHKSGRKVVGFNTDGIFYQGDIYHGQYEGAGLGEWANDYINCKIRFKSDGAYEFVGTAVEINEDNSYSIKSPERYYARIRGRTVLDRVKPDRDTWEWGDVFSLDAGKYLKYRIKDDYLIEDWIDTNII